MFDKIQKKNKKRPIKIVVHSLGGLGKTTFGVQAAKANNGLFILAEDGLNSLDAAEGVARTPLIETWEDFQKWIRDLMVEKHEFKSVVIDTIDALVPMLDKFVVDKYHEGDQKKADAYKAKYAGYYLEFNKMLAALDTLNQRGMEVIILAHSVVENHRDPATEAWNRWEINLPGGNKTDLAARLYDWSDICLFANYDVVVSERRGHGGHRVAYTKWNAAYDAKSRFDLPGKMKFDYNFLKSKIIKKEDK